MADQGSEGLLSPFLRRKRIEAARPYLEGRVLDIGCGSGELARLVRPENYLGLEIDEQVLALAKRFFPNHQFVSALPKDSGYFDTIIMLAVIEHIKDPGAFLKTLTPCLKASPSSRVVLTTPHPACDWVHTAGAAIGIFSKHASEEHERLLNRQALEEIGASAGLCLSTYRRFLFGANQLAVYNRVDGK